MTHAGDGAVGDRAAGAGAGVPADDELAALLLLVAWNMSEVEHFIHTLKVAQKSDVAVLLTCFG